MVPIVTSILIGLAVFLVARVFSSGPIAELEFKLLAPLERQRREQVRTAKPTYHHFERMTQDLRPIAASFSSGSQLSQLKKSLSFSPVYQHMEPDEFLALKSLEGMLAGIVVGAIVGAVFGLVPSVVCVLVVLGIYVAMSQAEVLGIAERNRRAFLLRLPSSVDLLSLMLEAGATFPESLSTLVNENKGHPLGEHLGQVERELSLGRPRADALRALRDRINEPVVDELVMAINEGEEFGTPLAKILASQAERMRLKKSQWIEKAAAEAQVKMSFPSLLIMIACSLVVLGPFVLQAVYQFFGE